MKKLLVMMMFMVGACSTTGSNDTTKKEFISQVAGKSVTIGFFYGDGTGDFEETSAQDAGLFTIYEVIDDSTAIYKAEEETTPVGDGGKYYIYLKFEIKDGKIYATDNYNCSSAEQAKNSTTKDVSI